MKVVNVKQKKSAQIVSKLALIDDYNKKMGGVDKNDAIVGNYSSVRKSYKWTNKVFFHFLEEALFNSFVVYKASGGTMLYIKYKLDVIESMFKYNDGDITVPILSADRYRGKHYPEIIPETEKKKTPQKRCSVCAGNGTRKETRYQCMNCRSHPGLCAAPCFMIYHTGK